MTSAKTQQQFKSAWIEHINQISALGLSLPNSLAQELFKEIESIKRYVDLAIYNTYCKTCGYNLTIHKTQTQEKTKCNKEACKTDYEQQKKEFMRKPIREIIGKV